MTTTFSASVWKDRLTTLADATIASPKPQSVRSVSISPGSLGSHVASVALVFADQLVGRLRSALNVWLMVQITLLGSSD